MTVTIYHYPACSTCKKALKWLDANNISYTAHHIVDAAPTREQLTQWWQASGLDLKRLFNTSGQSYRDLNLKDRYDARSDDERLDLLAGDGKLIKRPLAILNDGKVLVGFKEADYAAALTP